MLKLQNFDFFSTSLPPPHPPSHCLCCCGEGQELRAFCNRDSDLVSTSKSALSKAQDGLMVKSDSLVDHINRKASTIFFVDNSGENESKTRQKASTHIQAEIAVQNTAEPLLIDDKDDFDTQHTQLESVEAARKLSIDDNGRLLLSSVKLPSPSFGRLKSEPKSSQSFLLSKESQLSTKNIEVSRTKRLSGSASPYARQWLNTQSSSKMLLSAVQIPGRGGELQWSAWRWNQPHYLWQYCSSNAWKSKLLREQASVLWQQIRYTKISNKN